MPKIEYSNEQKRCFEVKGKNLQINAGAGSGKTETISKRCATLIKKGTSPDKIIAFTFTNNAADSLRSRIEKHISDMLGVEFLPKLSQMFIGTIHSYCFELLQKYEPGYATFDVVDEHKVAGLLSKEFENIGLDKLGIKKHWETISIFLENANAVENELIPVEKISNQPFKESFQKFQKILFDYHLLTFGQLISLTLKMLERKEIYDKIVSQIQHIIVDEYQDINPAQEKLIEILSSGTNFLTVVGDDLQSIYQWRGSTVKNILTFENRYPNVRKETLLINYRSRPGIIRLAKDFSDSISPKFEKKMVPYKRKGDVEYFIWLSDSPKTEAIIIGNTILSLIENGCAYGDIAILLRSVRTSSEPFINVFRSMGIPFQCGERAGLFLQPEAQIFGMTYAWLINEQWRANPFDRRSSSINLKLLLNKYANTFDLNAKQVKKLKSFLKEWKADASVGPPKSLVKDFYLLLELLAIQQWELSEGANINRMGTLARFSQLLADFEHVAFRRHRSTGRRRIKNFYYKLFNYLQYYALSAYEGHPGEISYQPNVVTISTVHQAKGLEWPIVFIPCLSSSRFPSSKTGTRKKWFIDADLFAPEMRARYEGTETDERRLFFVAMTRAKEKLYLSTFKKIKNLIKPSPFLLQCNDNLPPPTVTELPIGFIEPESHTASEDRFTLSVSQISMIDDCPFSFRLRDLLGFPPPLSIELGYGLTAHHILRRLAEYTMKHEKIPENSYFNTIVNEEFYLPYATERAFSKMKTEATEIIQKYIHKYKGDFLKICQVERSLQLFLQSCTITGRADALLKDKPKKFVLLDFKTSVRPESIERYFLQQSIYSHAAIDGGLNISKCYIDSIKTQERSVFFVDKDLLEKTRKKVNDLVKNVSENKYKPNPGKHCIGCDVRWMCKFRKKGGKTT